MDPQVWGPPGWTFLHSITLAYPACPKKEDKEAMRTFFMNVGNVLPCDKCQSNFKKHLKKYPLTNRILCSREGLVNWLIDIHNEVNKMHGKRELSYEEVLQIYQEKYSGRKSFTNYLIILLFIIIAILLLVLGSLLYLRYRKS